MEFQYFISTDLAHGVQGVLGGFKFVELLPRHILVGLSQALDVPKQTHTQWCSSYIK